MVTVKDNVAIANANVAMVMALECKNNLVGTQYEINDGRIVAIIEKRRKLIGENYERRGKA